MVDIGTEFKMRTWFSSRIVNKTWTVCGYVYYSDDLYYVCVDARGKQEDCYYEDVENVC